MSHLTSERRNALPDSAFAGKDRSYPVNDKAHARNALARASQQLKAGNLSASEKAQIDRRANEVLYGNSRGRSDGAEKVAKAMMGAKKKR